jgi:SAM-dependent methyltransferase
MVASGAEKVGGVRSEGPTMNAVGAASLPACRLCGGACDHAMDKNSFAIVRCTRCGFMFAIVPEAASTANIYTEDEFFFAGRDAERANGRSWYDVLWQRKRPFYLARLKRIGEMQRPGRMLDIGCAAGYMMRAARGLGWEVAGVEPSPAMRRRAHEQHGLTVYESLDEARATRQVFDCVMMFEVIEHLEDPVAVMRRVRELVAPGGLVALSTPNCAASHAAAGRPLDIWFVPPAHVSYFSAATLADCLQRAGFAPVALEGLTGYGQVLAGEIMIPRWLMRALGPLRRGKRLVPHGALGKLIKYVYTGRLDLYQRSGTKQLADADILELYARPAT